MATHPSILAWEIPRTEESGGLQSVGSQRVRHDEHARRRKVWGGRKGGGVRGLCREAKVRMEERPCHPATGSTTGPSRTIIVGVGLGQAPRRNGQSTVQFRARKTGRRGCMRPGQCKAASGGVHDETLAPCSLCHSDL